MKKAAERDAPAAFGLRNDFYHAVKLDANISRRKIISIYFLSRGGKLSKRKADSFLLHERWRLDY